MKTGSNPSKSSKNRAAKPTTASSSPAAALLTRESEISRKEGEEENILEFLRLKFPFGGIPFGLSSGKSLFDASRDLSVSHLGKLEEFTFSFSGVEY